jgi:hypothetical protein
MDEMHEKHPWKVAFTVASLLVALYTMSWSFSVFVKDLTRGDMAAIFVCSIVVTVGVVWILKKSKSFSEWSSLNGGERFIGYVLMIPGMWIVIVAAMALVILTRGLIFHKD